MHYTITLRNNIKVLFPLILIFVCCIGGIIYIENTDGKHSYAIIFATFFFVLSALPCIYLHLEYYMYNKGRSMDIFPEKGHFIWANESGQKTIEFSEIEKILICRTPSGFRKNSIRYLPFEGYHYAIIYLKSKETIIFTSLMAPIIEDAAGYIIGVEIELKKRFFCNIVLR
ncbi:MAG TPA: hypothetical protein VK890_10300 [Bacteroidia bacterium]|jgi:hypothetical protein|nr:hypothetical protein [Bacteroidia bacterium]